MGKVRLADIAKKVGVSTVTVHNALAGNKGVSEELREKIQSVASEMAIRFCQNENRKHERQQEKQVIQLVCLLQKIILHSTKHFIGKCIRNLR